MIATNLQTCYTSDTMAKPKQSPKTLYLGELFSGPGGLALGALLSSKTTSSGYQIIPTWANDYDSNSCVTYANNLMNGEFSHMYCQDVATLKIEDLPPIDVFTYGFPCNDFSIVGEQKGFQGKFGPLYTYGIRVLNKFKPKFFVAENVGGLSSANRGEAMKQIISELSRAGNGYNITAHLYKAEEYGIPQSRHRIIIVGIDKRLKKVFKVPSPTHLKNYVAVSTVLENIPEGIANHEFKKQSRLVTERLQLIKPGENVWNAKLPDHLQIHIKSAAKLSQIYRRLHPDKPSYTLTASGGGGTHGYHYKEPRALTNRERARIQTFPDNFVFHGSAESVRKQIGMAVPPKLGQIVFTGILNTLSNTYYPYIQPNIVVEYNLNLYDYFNNPRTQTKIISRQSNGSKYSRQGNNQRRNEFRQSG